MSQARVVAICIAPAAGAPMEEVEMALALADRGCEGDRYCTSEGSFNKGRPGARQVTLMNAIFFKGTPFVFADSRRNLFVEGVELMWLIGREFTVGDAVLRGLKYCDPCERPSKLTGKSASFKDAFFDRGGLVADVVRTGIIVRGCPVIPPPKGY